MPTMPSTSIMPTMSTTLTMPTTSTMLTSDHANHIDHADLCILKKIPIPKSTRNDYFRKIGNVKKKISTPVLSKKHKQ